MTQNKYSPNDFKSDQEIRWCAGCGDHAIFNSILRAMAQLDIPREKYTFISGIGCSSRFPYYVNTYAFHGIHGRAGAIASGVKVANPDLSVWQITGDGDALAIGGNHFIHEIRRNIDLNVVLFNNQIYGLTKGQYSPTSDLGQKTKSSPFGTVERPFRPGELTIGAQGSFFARAVDANMKMMTEVFVEAAKHKGTSIVEVLQNCVIYNDKTHAEITDRKVRDDRQVYLKHGEPMIFGKNNDKGLILDGKQLKAVKIGENGITEKDILIHDAKSPNPTMHWLLATMTLPDLPIAMGVIRATKQPAYEDEVVDQINEIQATSKIKNMDDLLNSGNTWMVE